MILVLWTRGFLPKKNYLPLEFDRYIVQDINLAPTGLRTGDRYWPALSSSIENQI